LTGAQWAAAGAKKQDSYIERALKYWRERGFPYYRLSAAEMVAEFAALSRVSAGDIIYGDEITGSNVGLRLANHFHPQMWSVRVSRYKTPMECFEDDDTLRAALRRSYSVWPDRHGANASCLRRILKTFSNCSAVSNFRPVASKAIIARYSQTGETVVDFSAGYGGRLVGSLSLVRHYIGIEPCTQQIRGLRQCVRTIQRLGISPGSADILPGCAEDVLPQLPPRTCRLVFSSPPYFDWERYSDQATQSCIRYANYSEWIDGFLVPVVEESRRVLVRGGFLAVNFPHGDSRVPLLTDLKRIAVASGLKLCKEYRLRLSKLPYLHPRTRPRKWEALAVFRRD